MISDRHSGVKGSYIDASAAGANSTGPQSDWLMSWLGQQNPIFYSTTSGNFPYSFSTKLTTGNSGQPYHLIPAGSSAGRRTTTPPFVLIPSDPSQVLLIFKYPLNLYSSVALVSLKDNALFMFCLLYTSDAADE